MDLTTMRLLIQNSKKLTAFTGAGISTNCGIPDFRGPEGIYEIARRKYDLPTPESLFDLAYFKNHPEPFFDFLNGMIKQSPRPGVVHQFLAEKEKREELALVLTQNIDNLHQKAGLTRLLACHGTMDRGHCLSCHKEYSYGEYIAPVLDNKIPLCSCGGIIKPDIVFFGESLPEEFYTLFQDMPETDLFVAMGTSLKVDPAASWAVKMAINNRSILINREKTDYDHLFDHVIHRDLDSFFKPLQPLND
jgi:NAD-dependent SIR2 family protein deacetylase